VIIDVPDEIYETVVSWLEVVRISKLKKLNNYEWESEIDGKVSEWINGLPLHAIVQQETGKNN
jgi:hypothetical protein